MLTNGLWFVNIGERLTREARNEPWKLNNDYKKPLRFFWETRAERLKVIPGFFYWRGLEKWCVSIVSERLSSKRLVLTERWVLIQFIGEFDPGSGRTLAACLTHASRTDWFFSEMKVSGGRVSNAWATCLTEGDNIGKLMLIPHNIYWWHRRYIKGAIRCKMGSRPIR